MGLFKLCYYRCDPYLDDYFIQLEVSLNLVTRTEACAAFIILALITTICSLVQLIFSLGRRGFGSIIGRVRLCSWAGTCSGAIALFIWIGTLDQCKDRFPAQNYKFAFSFFLALTAVLLNLVTVFFLKMDEGSEHYLAENSRPGGIGLS